MGSPIRAYTDTSVFGGVFDEEFSKYSTRYFDLVSTGIFIPVVSLVVVDEMAKAPPQVQNFFSDCLKFVERIAVTEESVELRDDYLHAGIVSEKWSADAMHVALASVARCPLIVSWNFKHIVNYKKIPLYNAVNRIKGFPEIGIFTPQEVASNEE